MSHPILSRKRQRSPSPCKGDGVVMIRQSTSTSHPLQKKRKVEIEFHQPSSPVQLDTDMWFEDNNSQEDAFPGKVIYPLVFVGILFILLEAAVDTASSRQSTPGGIGRTPAIRKLETGSNGRFRGGFILFIHIGLPLTCWSASTFNSVPSQRGGTRAI